MPLLAPAAANKRFDTDFYVEGYATTFDDPYVLYECDGIQYKEIIDRHALDGADLSDVIMQYDHGGRVFARTGRSNTLLVVPDDHGLFMAADLSKTEQARSMHEDISAGLITKMSWAFTVREDSYDRETHTRRILSIQKVYDVHAAAEYDSVDCCAAEPPGKTPAAQFNLQQGLQPHFCLVLPLHQGRAGVVDDKNTAVCNQNAG